MLISIIIPYFKDPSNIENAVESALSQTYTKLEIIIIDNENSINSKKILKKISKKSKKIGVFSNEKLGNYAGIGRNFGISFSKGELIAFLDSDDLWSKDKLKLQVKELKDKKVDILFTNFRAINDKNKELYKVKSPSLITFKDLIKSCPVCLSSVLIKKKCFKKNKFKKIKTKEDYELWLNFLKSGYKIRTLNYFCTFYRVR
ncbi:glycosyltransferase, partial [Candidatus Pelagibacter sp.]|nr:glycosyltransferase [Candidatus Pelagibacter sp.]